MRDQELPKAEKREPMFHEQVEEIATRLMLEGHPCGKELLDVCDFKARLKKMPAKKIEAFIDHMLSEAALSERLKQMDNPELVWRFYKTELPGRLLGIELAYVDEIIRRLYPEWDGENVESTETGWRTPEGEIKYE
jgi:hypothetical protein